MDKLRDRDEGMGHGDQERERDKRKVQWPSFVRVSVAMIKHNDQSNLGNKVWTSLQNYTFQFSAEGRQGRNLEAGTRVEAMEEDCSFPCSSWLSYTA